MIRLRSKHVASEGTLHTVKRSLGIVAQYRQWRMQPNGSGLWLGGWSFKNPLAEPKQVKPRKIWNADSYCWSERRLFICFPYYINSLWHRGKVVKKATLKPYKGEKFKALA